MCKLPISVMAGGHFSEQTSRKICNRSKIVMFAGEKVKGVKVDL